VKLLKFLLVAGVLAVIAFIGIGLWLPNDYVVERSVTVQAPPVIAFAQVNDLHKWEQWSPWSKLDPDMVITYGDKTIGAGASYAWKGKKSGSGKLTIRESELGKRIDTLISFEEKGEGLGYWVFEKEGRGCKVTWGMTGRNAGPVGGWFSLIIDEMLGGQFEDGLAGVKEMAELEAKEKPAIGSALEQVLKQAGQDLEQAGKELADIIQGK